MRLHGRVMLVGLLLAAACGDDDDAAVSSEERTAQLVAASLTSNVKFAEGVVELGEIPDSSDDTVSLKQEDQVLSLEPDITEVLALEVDNPNEDDDPIESTLMQFEGDDEHHVEVPKGKGGDGGTGAINIDFKVDGDVCSKLCNDSFEITMIQAVKLSKGGVSKHLKRTIKLDCSKAGDPARCEKTDKPSGASGKGGTTPRDAGTTTGPKDSGTKPPSTPADATLAKEFASALATANNGLCSSCPQFMSGSCSAMLPRTAVACIQASVEANGSRADANVALNELTAKLKQIATSCMSCDLTTCSPDFFADNIKMLPDDIQMEFEDCATAKGGMIGTKVPDAGAAP